MAERRVLVVDDDRMVHTIVRAAIEKHGYKVSSAFDAMQVPMMARQLKPDLIVLDINMP
jgi:DNA-binding response OmpR family regulator